jgi:hypothetical protein
VNIGGQLNMKSGINVLTEMKELGDKFFLTIKDRQCKANPYLAGCMSEKVFIIETERKQQKRLLKMALVAFEIIGLGDATDPDYVKVSMESTMAAESSKISFSFEALNEQKSEIASIVESMLHVRRYVRQINDSFNDFEGTNISSGDIWEKLEIFLRAYWIEKQKNK